MTDSILTPADAGKTIAVHSGERVTIQLDENPTTGYRWAIDQIDEQILTLENSSFVAAPGVGSGGQRTFQFRAHSPGTVHLQLKNWREWLGDASIRDRFDVTIAVH
jgi:inhibitor of cysteine peptidase